MALKRKRSETTLSPFSNPSNSSSSDRESSSSPTPHQSRWPSNVNGDISMAGSNHQLHQIDNWAMTINPISDATPQHLHSRTRKRFRDNRPDEHTVYEQTYQKLFSAQRSPEPTPALPRTDPTALTSFAKHSNPQASLHSFWALPYRCSMRRQISTTFDVIPLQQHRQQLKCEDCDACFGSLPDDGDMAVDVDMGGMGTEHGEFACSECRRTVCDMCAVAVLGVGRECLQCKTSRKRWVGGIGWVP